MSVPKLFILDTNMLVHAINKDAGKKHEVAAELLKTAPAHRCVLTLQAIGEFIHVAKRKEIVPMDQVIKLLNAWQAIFTIASADQETCLEALEYVQDHKIPYWDAMLWVTAKQAGCAYVLSDGMHHGRRLGGVEMVNPFAKDAKPIIEGLYKTA